MLNTIANFIWGIADDCLRDVYVRGKYRDVILPMTVIRRLDAVLEGTKPQVLDMKKTLDAAGITNQLIQSARGLNMFSPALKMGIIFLKALSENIFSGL